MVGKQEFSLSQMCYFLWQGEVPCNDMGLSVSWATEKLSMSGSLPSSCFFLMLLMGYCSQGISGQIYHEWCLMQFSFRLQLH